MERNQYFDCVFDGTAYRLSDETEDRVVLLGRPIESFKAIIWQKPGHFREYAAIILPILGTCAKSPRGIGLTHSYLEICKKGHR